MPTEVLCCLDVLGMLLGLLKGYLLQGIWMSSSRPPRSLEFTEFFQHQRASIISPTPTWQHQLLDSKAPKLGKNCGLILGCKVLWKNEEWQQDSCWSGGCCCGGGCCGCGCYVVVAGLMLPFLVFLYSLVSVNTPYVDLVLGSMGS